MLLAQTFVLQCTAVGLDTAIMEGYAAPRLLRRLPIANKWRYAVPCVICVGTSAAASAAASSNSNDPDDDVGQEHGRGKTSRLSVEDVVGNWDGAVDAIS